MFRSLLFRAFLTFGVPDHFLNPCSIYSLPADFIPVLFEESFQSPVFHTIITA